MAIVDDVKRDRRTKQVLSQTNTKTVGPPLTSTGLVGDQLPDEIFTIDDYDKIKNQVNLEENNFQLIEALVKMGMITQKLSVSGPIAGTGTFADADLGAASGSSVSAILYTPAKDTVWQVCAASLVGATNRSGTFTSALQIAEAGSTSTNVVYVEQLASSSNEYQAYSLDSPLFIDDKTSLSISVNGTFDAFNIRAYLIRVR
jgi:hypothetical protein